MNIEILPKPVVSRWDGLHGHSQTNRRNFGSVEVVCTKEAERIKEVEQKQEESRGDRGRMVCAKGVGHSERSHAERHSSTAYNKANSSPKPVDKEKRNETWEKFKGHVACSKDLGKVLVESQIVLEENRDVERDKAPATHLLQKLSNDAEHESIEEPIFSHGENIFHGRSVLFALFEREFDATHFGYDLFRIQI